MKSELLTAESPMTIDNAEEIETIEFRVLKESELMLAGGGSVDPVFG